MKGLIWWLWTAFSPPEVHIYDVIASDEDVAWLGEVAWTARTDNAGTGLR